VPDDPLLAIADELYALNLPAFTPRRDALAKELRASDKDLSASVKALKKPSTAAWVVNLFVRREAGQVDQVLTVGAALREAQASLDGEELRALTRQRRQLTAAVTTQARSLAADAGVKVTSAVADQVEATLTAAMVDERAAAAVRSGLLVAAVSATGVDEVEIAVAVPSALGFTATRTEAEVPPRPELHVVPDPDADEKAIAAAQKVLDETEAAVARATTSLESAAAEVAELEARSMQLQAEIDELKRRLSDLEGRSEDVDDELSDAEDVKAEAEDAMKAATRTRDAAAAALAKLLV
jgi:peptidoglycan hydrolase CwlO-like protein